MKPVWELMARDDYEQVLFCQDATSGLRALIAIHDTTLGPAIGGVRRRFYENEDVALDDVLGLARAMTLKAAITGLNLGGGAAVILADDAEAARRPGDETLWRAFGRAVERLHGRFIVGEDAGTTVADIETIGQETAFVVGIGKSRGGGGTPSDKAALGVLSGMRACLLEAFGDSQMRGRRVVVQGVGDVGYALVRLLAEAEAVIAVADPDPRALDRVKTRFPQVEVIEVGRALTSPCDILAPCALGGVFTLETVPTVQARIIAGAANNQLAADAVGDLLHQRGILYAPDFVINAGGLINAADELEGYDEARALAHIGRLGDSVTAILRSSRERNISTTRAAGEQALERIRRLRDVGRTFLPGR